ncbi:TonB-dependent receptor [Parachitinimonas caeni]|uniref:TonB-dependent receptor n=1 Tax=Parachitinimonas caeni TaxID=3031301 RepID=A0ABT7DQZ6_9NEIS|nr:TonB-dependent receptor [Parachitinimonas caeni]MDK2122486.1 TonB-dependent receptor [Parachitinimonas caeni]
MRFLFTLGALCATGTALAAEDTSSIETVVVTASRVPMPPRNLAVNLSVIDRQDIERSSATSLSELLAGQAGVTSLSLDSTNNGSVGLRGFGIAGPSNTQILLNGIKLNENDLSGPRIGQIPLSAVEKIEIVRGSGAVLYGSGAVGGVINIITRGSQSGGLLEAKVGSFSTAALNAHYQIADGGNSLKAGIYYLDSDHWRRNNREQTRSGNLEGNLQLGAARVTANLTSERERLRLPGPRRIDSSRNLDQMASDPRGTASPDDHSWIDTDRAQISVDKSVDNVRLLGDIGWRRKTGFIHYGGQYPWNDRREISTLSISPRLAWRHQLAGMSGDLIAGLDISRATADRFGGATDQLDASGGSEQKTRALYIDQTTAISHQTRLNLGVRHERSHHQVRGFTPADNTDSLTAWQVGLRQQLTEAINAYGRIGKSFRFANADELADNANLRPQTGRDVELGIEYTTAAWYGRAAVFQIKLNDEIHYNPLAGTYGQNINLDPSSRQGLELESRLRTGAIDWHGNYSYTRSRYDGGRYGAVSLDGNDLPLTPRHKFNLSVGMPVAEGTRLDLDWQLVSRSRLDNDQANQATWLAGYGVVGVKLSHQRGPWQLSLSGQNLTDQRYASYGVKSSFGSAYNVYPNQGRAFYLTGAYRF